MDDLEIFKTHIRLDGNAEDNYLTLILSTAKNAVETAISQPVDSDTVKYTNTGQSKNPESGKIWPELQMAILLVGADLYNNRESVAYAQSYVVPHTFDYLISPFIKYRSA